MVMQDEVDTFFEHHGVKGQKWGVRNDKGHEGESAKTKTIAKADKAYEKSFSGVGGYVKIQNQMAEHINARVATLNDKHKDKDISVAGSKEQKAYLKDYEKLVDSAAAASTKAFGTNASGTGQVKITRHGEGYESTWQAKWEDLKHADSNSIIKITPKFNDKGFIVSTKLEVVDEGITQSDVDEFVLKHVGVLGMKWGKYKADSIPDGEVRVTQKKPGTKVTAAGGAKIEAHPDAVKAASNKQVAKKSTTDALSTPELQALVNRMNLEQQYTKLTTQQVSPGRKFVNKLLVDVIKEQGTKVAKDQATKLVTEAVKKKAAG